MATIKGTSNALGNLINKINSASATSVNSGVGNGNINIDDSIPTNMLNPEPVIKINFKSSHKQCIKKAKEQLMIIVKEVVPILLQTSSMIADKVEQDAEQLGNLYYEYIKTEQVIQANMNAIGQGELSPRLFEVYAKLSKQQSELANLITNTQNTMRKNYIDTYMDLQQKDDADEHLSIIGKQEDGPKALEYNDEHGTKSKQNIMLGTDNLTKMLAERKKKALIAKFEEVK